MELLNREEQQEQQRVIAEKREAEWQRIVTLIKRKGFQQARQAIERWQGSGEAPANLHKLLAFLESE